MFVLFNAGSSSNRLALRLNCVSLHVCLSAAFNPAHFVPDVPGRQMTPAGADKNEHVLKEECEGNK